ncbi:MAG: hypothetical protein RL769_671 [Pseudomonadota bacterium]|jgi:hypothetical protein
MLDKLDRNKLMFFLLLIFSLASCRFVTPMATLAICENNKRFLLKDMTIDEVKASVAKGIFEKNEYNYNVSYTVISGKSGSMMINNIKPEEFNRCQLRYVSYYRNYRYFQRK